MYRVNKSIVPPGGWRCPANPESSVIITADSYQQLIQEVHKYRLQNRMDYRNMQEEIDAYLASISPSTVTRVKTPPKRAPHSLADKIYNWACQVFDNTPTSRHYAPRPVADQRVSICSKCPFNDQRNNISSCGPCRETTAAMLRVIRGQRETAYDYHVGGCTKFDFDIRTAVHLEDDTLGEKSGDAPSQCWRRAV